MTERGEISRELVRRAAIGFPFGAALVYLVFLLGGLFGFPAPEGTAVPVVTAAMAERWGSPISGPACWGRCWKRRRCPSAWNGGRRSGPASTFC